MSYIEQINIAISYIEDHLFDPITYDEISKVSGFSRWHFGRIIRAMVGDTIKEYTQKRRLSFANHYPAHLNYILTFLPISGTAYY
ncbi:MAG: hypothetical protein OEY59_10200 [Deltaproteobacteria bacterium]|nr:hypothetical protein [Deltaproteobacteria bacterium]